MKAHRLVPEGHRLELQEGMYNINAHKNICTLHVAKKLSGRSDKEVIQAFLRYGWEPGKGAGSFTYLPAMYDLGIRFGDENLLLTEDEDGHVVAIGKSFGSLRDAYNSGTFVMETEGHMFCMLNGLIFDLPGNKPPNNIIIQMIYEITSYQPST